MIEPRQYRKKPVVIEAMQFDGTDVGAARVISWAASHGVAITHDSYVKFDGGHTEHWLRIPTLEGEMLADVGDWIVQGTRGEFYPVKPESFSDTFEEVEVVELDRDCCTDESEPCDNELCYRAVRDYGDLEVSV